MADIKRILRKRRWTGRDLGILELTNMCEIYRQGLIGNTKPQPIVEPARFKEMLDTIRGTEAGRDYNGYLAIYEWLRLHNYLALANEQQAQLQVETMKHVLSNASTAEILYQYINQLPLIVTEKQYNDMRDEARESTLKEWGPYNLFHLVDLALTFLSRQITDNQGEEDNPLRALKDELMAAPITSQLILGAWNEEDRPHDMTQWEVISEHLLFEFYDVGTGTLRGDPDEPEAIAQVKDFLNQFPEAAAAALEDIRKKGLIPASFGEGIPEPELWLEPLISERELYERDIYGARESIESDGTLFDGNKRALWNGIAIVRSSDFLQSSRIDDKGYYEPPQIAEGIKPLSLEAYIPEEEYSDRLREEIRKSREALLRSFKVILGYNTALVLISDMFDVPEIQIFGIDVEAMQRDIDHMNRIGAALGKLMEGSPAGDYFLKEKKLAVLREVFPPFDTSTIQIPEENIAAAKALMKDYRAFRGGGEADLHELLFYFDEHPAGAGKEGANG